MLFRTRRSRRRHYRRQRRNYGHRIAWALLLLASLSLPGCKGRARASLERRYAEARLQFQQGYTDQAEKAADNGDHGSADYLDLNWKFRVLRAEISTRKGNPKKALDLLAQDPPTTIADEVRWRGRLVQAFALCQLHDYPAANQRLNDAQQLAAEKADLKAELLYFRGRCEVTKDNIQEAEKYFQQVLQAAVVDDFVRAWSSANLGLCAKRVQRFEDAIDWYLKAESAFGSLRARPLEEAMMGNLGFLYLELRDFARAKDNTERAVNLAVELKILPDQQNWLLDLGRVQQAQGQSGAAEQSYQKALSIAQQLGNRDIAYTCLRNLTVVKLNAGELDLATKYHLQAKDLEPAGDNLLFWQLNDATLSAARHDYPAAENVLQKLLTELELPKDQVPNYRLLWGVKLELAHVYADEGKFSEAEHWYQSSITAVEDAAAKMKRAEFRTAMLDNMPVFDDYVAFLIDRKQTAKALQVAQAGRARTLAQGLGIPQQRQQDPNAWLAKIQGFLRMQHAVVLSYFASEKECYLWTITPTEIRLSPLGIARPDLDSLVDRYRQEISDHADKEASTAAKKLFQVLVQPASDLTPQGTHVIVVADSKIYSVNFETLITTQGTPRYWIDDVDVDNASSIDLLMAGRARATQAKGLLLMGAAVQVDPHFGVLPHATEEMQSVNKHFAASEVKRFAGPDATPHAYLSSAPGQYKYIYLATHGASNAVEPLESAIILSRDNQGSFKLFARDIMDQKLKLNADLVTISACEGAGTNVQSLEGLLGLEWAFLRAGAHQVVAALWDVDDAVTPKLMDDFYSEISKGKNAAVALRTAKRAMLHTSGYQSRPYYWAALQLYTGS